MIASNTAIVTGGAKGIGRAVSERLAENGWNLILCGRDQRTLEETAIQIREKSKVQVEAVSLDLSESSGVQTLFSRWKNKPAGLPRALVCNAGNYGTLGKLVDVDFSEWKKSFDLNFFSVAEIIQTYLKLAQPIPGFRRKIAVMGGSGLGSSTVWPGISAYACAKGSLNRLVEVIHEESFESGVDTNCIAPGAVKTGITDQAAALGEKVLGAVYKNSMQILSKGGDSPWLAGDAIVKLFTKECDGLSGRLISAKWDGKFLDHALDVSKDKDLLRLRRIDNELFGKLEKK